jgi:hypothetical protein
MTLTLTTQNFADLTAYANRDAAPKSCSSAPTPTPAAPAATPTAAATATPLACGNDYFDGSYDTTAAFTATLQLGAGITGNINAGRAFFGSACGDCHPTGLPTPVAVDVATMQALQNAYANGVATKGMPDKSAQISVQDWADLTALSNSDKAPANCGQPTPTPAPVNPYLHGQALFQMCLVGCHQHDNFHDVRGATAHNISEAIHEVSSMSKFSSLTSQEIADLATYLANPA